MVASTARIQWDLQHHETTTSNMVPHLIVKKANSGRQKGRTYEILAFKPNGPSTQTNDNGMSNSSVKILIASYLEEK
jgi:hypothetical protein